MTSYSRLSALDRSFLDIEKRNTHMHVGATCLFEAGPLAGAQGSIDIDKIRTHIEARLRLIPRFRQRIAHIPVENHPIWVDDDQFNIRYHVRHTSLPRPGDARQLKRLAGWINSQQLDRGKPLWEIWVIEGLEDGRFALLSKTHHCMIDGLAGADLMAVLLSAGDEADPEEPGPWIPREVPGTVELLRDAIGRRLALPLRLARKLMNDPAKVWNDAGDAVSAIVDLSASALRPVSETPLNRVVGSHRRFDWLEFDLDRVKAIKNHFGATINDVVLAAVSGGIHRFLTMRGTPIDSDPDFVFRAFCPVGLHAGSRNGASGNFVSAMITDLPIGEENPGLCLARIGAATREHKNDATVRGTAVIEGVADWTFPGLVSVLSTLVESNRSYNVIVTNVPGPQFPLYLLGARMIESYPLVPLFGHQGVGIALLSYDHKLFWGFSADRDIVPDLHDLVEAVRQSFADLGAAAGLRLAGHPLDLGSGHDSAGDRRDGGDAGPGAILVA